MLGALGLGLRRLALAAPRGEEAARRGVREHVGLAGERRPVARAVQAEEREDLVRVCGQGGGGVAAAHGLDGGDAQAEGGLGQYEAGVLQGAAEDGEEAGVGVREGLEAEGGVVGEGHEVELDEAGLAACFGGYCFGGLGGFVVVRELGDARPGEREVDREVGGGGGGGDDVDGVEGAADVCD